MIHLLHFHISGPIFIVTILIQIIKSSNSNGTVFSKTKASDKIKYTQGFFKSVEAQTPKSQNVDLSPFAH